MRGCLVIRQGLISSTVCVVIELCEFLAPLGLVCNRCAGFLSFRIWGPAGRQILTAHLPRLHARAVICIPSSGQLWTPSARTNLQWGKKETDSQTQVHFLGSANSITGHCVTLNSTGSMARRMPHPKGHRKLYRGMVYPRCCCVLTCASWHRQSPCLRSSGLPWCQNVGQHTLLHDPFQLWFEHQRFRRRRCVSAALTDC